YLGVERVAQIMSLMLEGVSIRAISRLTNTDKKTILALLLTLGEKCRNLFDARVRGIRPRYVEMDELWCYVRKHEKRLKPDDPTEWGDAYTWIALDAQTKLAISYLV